ncbi:MAG: hypothetical protein WAM24_13215 [Ignavibacteriaceae bacterium]
MQIIKPNSVKRSYTQTINSSPGKVFPLLCPVREKEWVYGWDPELVITESGFAEKDSVFITKHGDKKSYWIITGYEPANYEIEMHIITPGHTAGKLEIKLHDDKDGKNKADINYSFISLSPEGKEFVKNYTEEKYVSFMKNWEEEINHYLLTGEKISE